MTRRIKSLLLIGIAAVCAASNYAQLVYWVPSSGTLQQGKANSLQLHFEGCAPEGEIALPAMPDLQLQQGGRTTSTSIVNGRMSQKYIVEYRATPLSGSSIVLPAFAAQTDKGPIEVAQASFEVVEATIGNTGVKPKDVIYSELQIKDNNLYVGELFDLQYIIGFKPGYTVTDISEPQWQPSEIVSTGFNSYEQVQFKLGAQQYSGLAYQAQGMATRSGMLSLPSASQNVSMVTGRRRGLLFDNRVVDSIAFDSNAPDIEIKPLPDGAPESFLGAVGEFFLESKVVPENVQVGEPITWTLSLQGSGNWPMGIGLPSRSLSKAFRAIQPEIKSDFPENSIFVGKQTEDIVLVPTQAGSFELGPIEYTYFNPKTESYETIRSEAATVSVSPLASAEPTTAHVVPGQGDPNPAGHSQAGLQVELDPSGTNMLSKLAEMPSEPQEALSLASSAPSGDTGLVKLLWAPVGAMFFWLLLALFRACALDPHAQRRQASRNLRLLFKAPINLEDSERFQALHRSWRMATRDFWEVASQEPSAGEIEKAVARKASEKQASRWRMLWEESDSFLFGNKKATPTHWLGNAKTAFKDAPKPHRSLKAFTSLAAWKVTLFAVACIGLLAPSPSLAQDDQPATDEATAAYRAGDFERAQRLWTRAIKNEPNNWILRHNAGLAHAQENEWGKAFGWWTSSFARNPQEPSNRWNLKLALNQTGAYDPRIASLLKDTTRSRFVTLLSPGMWEKSAQWARWCLALALCLWILARYIPQANWLGKLAIAAAISCCLWSVLADWAHRQYGYLSKPNCVAIIEATTLKSLPTDIEVEQIETALSEGALALAQKEFLGWTQIRLPNGETGWLRSETFMPLYLQQP